MTLVEAMSRQTAVLSTDAGGSVEVVGDSNNICSTVDDFVKRIMAFYVDTKLLKGEKEQNMKRVKEKYSLENNELKHKRMYNSILNHNSVF